MKKILLLTVCIFITAIAAQAQYNKVVAKDGTGDYVTLQASIDAAPTSSTVPWVIYIKNGKYNEKVVIPSNKPNIQLIGESVANVIVYYNDYAGRTLPGGGTIGQNCATITINAADFVAVNVSFFNTFNFDSAVAAGVTGSQALAVFINADRAAFKNCRFLGNQDTLLTKGSGTPRHYFYKCYIDGVVDFIYGNAVAIYDSCVVYAKSRPTNGNSFITAANTPIGQTYGYLFRDCFIPANTGNTLYFLGRPWGNSNGSVTSNTKVLFSNTLMSNSINPLGWTKWDATTDTSVITYAEFKSKNLDGTLTDVSKRVSWSKQFANADTVGYNIPTMFSGWNPCSVRADFCNYAAPEIAVSNFKATKTTSNAKFTWNISWAMNGIQYDVYRSIDNKASYQLLNSVTATNDTNINFNSSDVLPPSCTSYFYFVKASKTGYATNYTDTIEVSSSPAINLNTTSLNSFLQGSTAASNSQSFIVNANNLSTNVTVTPPANFEVSTDNATWVANPSTITLTPTAGAIANTTIYVRLNAATPNTYTGNIVFATNCSSNTITKSIAVNGTTLNIPLQQYSVIEQWNLTAHNGVDSLITDTFNIEPVNSKLNKLYVSNGTQVSTIPAYSTQFGQAFGATANGDGTWSTGSGGPGSTLNRNYYEEFVVKPHSVITNPCCTTSYKGAVIRIDSVVFNSAFYNTSSGIKLAVAYSKSHFTADSASVTGGRDVTGTTLPANANGAFATPIALSNQTSGPTAQYALSLNAGNLVEIMPGDSLTIRIYYACGSSSAGRYALLKNVQIKGEIIQILPLNFTAYSARLIHNKSVENKWQTTNEINVNHYNIQRSVNGKEFTTISKIKANNKTNNEYSYLDLLATNYPLLYSIYYRIEAIDNDGKRTYSAVKQLSINNSQSSIKIFPNPANEKITIETKAVKELFVVDYLGKIIKHTTIANNQLSTINYQLQKGVYIIKAIMLDGSSKTEKLIVE